jgi:hypothetical protein
MDDETQLSHMLAQFETQPSRGSLRNDLSGRIFPYTAMTSLTRVFISFWNMIDCLYQLREGGVASLAGNRASQCLVRT